ncbi:hypothetical protein [Catellatospora sp. IY07-71]|uniref:hypothetical protein n=1 Tax=Catellatospora sp. IY07-71 TaxID=2728827 RepID=UPI001BB341EA|nr:hypothetical protein [Catellatospora sp. IY07-71]
MRLDADRLLTMSQNELDDLFRQSPTGGFPQGEGTGTVIVAPGTTASATAAKLIHRFAWQGKVFDPERSELLNRVSPIGVRAVRAKVYRGTSLFDGRESIVLDYSRTSLIAHWIRDEMRLVSPSVYLGIVFWDNAKIFNFTLTFAH